MKIPLFKIYSDNEDIDAVKKVIEKGSFWAIGTEIEEFEKKIADYIGTKYAVAFNSGTSALHVLLLSYSLKGSEIIVPSFTFISTVNSVLLAGATPIFAETESETGGLDIEDVKQKITPKTKAIIALHYAGFPSRDIEKLRTLCDQQNLLLIEDAAESIGASINEKKIGSFGDSSILSFCQNKVLPIGEGGMILTNSREIYERSKLFRSHGRVENDYFSGDSKNEYIQLGYNFRLPTILASLGISQFKKLNNLISIRRNIAKYFDKNLSDIQEIKFLKKIENHFQVYQMYSILLPSKKIRDDLQNFLKSKSIASKIYFFPVHLENFYRKKFFCSEGDLPKTEKISSRILSLPFFPQLTIQEADYIIDSIKEFFKKENEKYI